MVGFVYDDEYLGHDTGPGHPERAERLVAVVRHLKESGRWEKLAHIKPREASIDEVTAVHPERHVRMVERRCVAGETVLDDGDTHVCPESFRVALLAAGATLRAVDCVISGEVKRAFCAVRPPGHHAGTERVMGFCLFNNIAVGARYAQKQKGVNRIAIVDWDVHHGNGTQEIFYSDPSVLYISLHQYPLWPGTGASGETGDGPGAGFTVNCPMKPGSGDAEYMEAFRSRIIPALNDFQPELLMLSAGFDAHRMDPLANINLDDKSFKTMTLMMRDVAERWCGGRIVSVLEGGYDRDALARCVALHLDTLD